MTLYQILHLLDDNMESKKNQLFDYLLYGCSDFGTHLEIKATKRAEPLPDRDIGEYKYVVFAVRFKFKHKNCTHDIFNTPKSLMRIQWAKNGYEVGKIVALSKNLGFGECYAFPLREVEDYDC